MSLCSRQSQELDKRAGSDVFMFEVRPRTGQRNLGFGCRYVQGRTKNLTKETTFPLTLLFSLLRDISFFSLGWAFFLSLRLGKFFSPRAWAKFSFLALPLAAFSLSLLLDSISGSLLAAFSPSCFLLLLFSLSRLPSLISASSACSQ